MAIGILETDYLVIGCGAAGMAFADVLVTESDADVVMVDRRHAPGGHWNDAYPFVRLHQPSAYYGVNSMPLGSEAIDRHGSNRGFYERAGAAEICAYYDRVMQQRLLPSGRVRHFPMCEYRGPHRIVSRASGEEFEIKVRRKVVDGRYLEPSVPATSGPPFEIAPGARCVPVNDLVRLVEHADGYVIIGAGKTAIDACLWLLEVGVPPEVIRWIKPREAWLLNRAFAQGGELVGAMFDGFSLQVEAAAGATSLDDLFARLEAAGQVFRVDERVTPTMYRSPTASAFEIEQLRRISGVVRLGRVRRIERDAVVLDEGTIPTSLRHLHVHCAAPGLNPAPSVPIFTPDRITLQPIRTGLIPFNAALAGFVEAIHPDIEAQNRLCPPNRLPEVPLDWVRGMLTGMKAANRWSKDAAVSEWLERSRLNPVRGLLQRADEPLVQRAMTRFVLNVRPAIERLQQLLDGEAASPQRFRLGAA
jgi:hypothetical protein